jgi:hypothetical protein
LGEEEIEDSVFPDSPRFRTGTFPADKIERVDNLISRAFASDKETSSGEENDQPSCVGCCSPFSLCGCVKEVNGARHEFQKARFEKGSESVEIARRKFRGSLYNHYAHRIADIAQIQMLQKQDAESIRMKLISEPKSSAKDICDKGLGTTSNDDDVPRRNMDDVSIGTLPEKGHSPASGIPDNVPNNEKMESSSGSRRKRRTLLCGSSRAKRDESVQKAASDLKRLAETIATAQKNWESRRQRPPKRQLSPITNRPTTVPVDDEIPMSSQEDVHRRHSKPVEEVFNDRLLVDHWMGENSAFLRVSETLMHYSSISPCCLSPSDKLDNVIHLKNLKVGSPEFRVCQQALVARAVFSARSLFRGYAPLVFDDDALLLMSPLQSYVFGCS